jgi:hypothetical protein
VIVATLALNTPSCQKRTPWFDSGATREEVHRILGAPANTDSHVVSVWTDSNKPSSGPRKWRDLLARHEVKYIVVFEENGRSIMYLVSPEQTMISSDLTDDEARKGARAFFGERPH